MLVLALLVALAAPRTVAAQNPPLAVSVTADGRAAVRVGDVLGESDLAEAVHSGLPLRLRFRLELWRDEWIDDLRAAELWAVVLLYDPLERLYHVQVPGAGAEPRSFRTYQEARSAAEAAYIPPIRPTVGGRYYYRATLQIETLSLSDIEELQHWLRGELAPAVRGGESLPGAFGEGLRRLLVRLLGLPARIYDVRSGYFRMP